MDVTQWLSDGLDDYCVNFLKMELGVEPKPLQKPTKDTFEKYKVWKQANIFRLLLIFFYIIIISLKQGLEEVHLNLTESQGMCLKEAKHEKYLRCITDFFQASLDGRLKKYHQIEKVTLTTTVSIVLISYIGHYRSTNKSIRGVSASKPQKSVLG